MWDLYCIELCKVSFKFSWGWAFLPQNKLLWKFIVILSSSSFTYSFFWVACCSHHNFLYPAYCAKWCLAALNLEERPIKSFGRSSIKDCFPSFMLYVSFSKICVMIKIWNKHLEVSFLFMIGEFGALSFRIRSFHS